MSTLSQKGIKLEALWRMLQCLLPPQDEETRRDFGFARTPLADDLVARLEVYSFLILTLGVRPKTINEWREQGKLGAMMKQKFDAERSGPRPLHYSLDQWFHKYQSTFDSSSDDHGPVISMLESASREAWIISGGSLSDLENHAALVKTFPMTKKNCFILVTLFMAGMRPAPCDGSDRWVTFGFCGCTSLGEEAHFSMQYRQLIQRVKLDVFHRAYVSGALAQLFATNELPITNRFILDVLQTPPAECKSVWWLKDFVCAEDDSAQERYLNTRASVDYGFSNCSGVEEATALQNIYKQAFDKKDFDPLELHDARVRGELFKYLSQHAKLKPPERFRRLLRNSTL
ncbi:hypothetical protein FRC10_002929 [Ceratobasidium sp. 414]|nr:hypothetical protein FRC10_002929 [Ceratobasidium sp. 414]